MRVITLAGSPRYPSRSSALLEYARETLTAADIEVCHWHLQNFPRKTSCTLVLTTRRCRRSTNSWPGLMA